MAPVATQSERRASTRAATVRAAVDAFVEADGIEVGLEEIAGRAGIAKSTILYHFGSRAALLRAVAVMLFQAQEAAVGPAVGDAGEWVTGLLRAQTAPTARLLHLVGDELASHGELGGADPIPEVARRLAELGVEGDPVVLSAAIVQFSRSIAYGLTEPDGIDAIVASLVRGARLG